VKTIARVLALALVVTESNGLSAQAAGPTIVLVHGAFGESSSWNGVINTLNNDGYFEVGDHGRI
jgi:pimeloyl-ACP methyl ester carboxylesterase